MAENPQQMQPRRGRGRPFVKGQSGNPAGKRPGTRSRITLLAEKLMENEATEVVRTVIDAAKAGDMTAARLILDRIAPPRRDRPVRIDLPPLSCPADVVEAMSAVISALSEGTISAAEASELSRLLDNFVKAVEANEIEGRVRRLEKEIP